MSDVTDRLDAIQAKWLPPLYAEPYGTPSDIAFLLDLARKQQAQLEAVRELAADAAEQPPSELIPVPAMAVLIRKELEAKP